MGAAVTPFQNLLQNSNSQCAIGLRGPFILLYIFKLTYEETIPDSFRHAKVGRFNTSATLIKKASQLSQSRSASMDQLLLTFIEASDEEQWRDRAEPTSQRLFEKIRQDPIEWIETVRLRNDRSN